MLLAADLREEEVQGQQNKLTFGLNAVWGEQPKSLKLVAEMSS